MKRNKINRFPWKKILLVAIGGALYFLGFCGYDQYYLNYIALIPFLFALESLNSKQAFWIAWFGGLVSRIGGFYWIAYTMHTFAHMSWLLSIVLFLCLACFQALQFGVWGFLISKSPHQQRLLVAWLAWIAIEKFWPFLFPNYLGNGQYQQTAIVQIADLGGVILVSAFIAAVNIMLYAIGKHVYKKQYAATKKLIAGLLVMVVLVLGYGLFKISAVEKSIAQAPKMRIGMVQANLGIGVKGRRARYELQQHQELSWAAQEAGADLITWPETGYPYHISYTATNVRERLLGNYLTTPHVFGAPFIYKDGDTYKKKNSAFLASGTGDLLGRYDKNYLLMFGEYLPFSDVFPWLHKLSPYSGRFIKGTENNVVPFGDIILGINICYEDIIGGYIRQQFKQPPQVLINITNDAWFGHSHEPRIHLALATFRSVEHHRWMVRNTNTGISAFIDPLGRITQEMPINTRGYAVETISLHDHTTIYSKLGDWPGWLSAFGIIAILVSRRRKKKQ